MIQTYKFFKWCMPVILFLAAPIIFAQAGYNEIGSFEQELPSYWSKGAEPSGSTLSWATDEFRSMGRSLKIEKTATSETAMWFTENSVDMWAPFLQKDVDMLIGAYVKTEGVNTNPSNDDERWWISYTFYDSAGVLIGETKLPIDQSAATSNGWVADTNDVAETVLPREAYKLEITFAGGKDATGTVWADDFMLFGREGAWAGQNWNTAVGVPTGWNYWLPPIGGNDGRLSNGYENTIVTDEEAHSGTYSLKFDLPFDRPPHDAWVGTQRMLLEPNLKPGDPIKISVWIKAENLVPDSAALHPETWAVGITPLSHSGYLPNDPYDEKGPDLQYTLPNVTSFDWTQFSLETVVPNPDAFEAKAMSVRIHVYSRFTGTVYFDDLTVEAIGSVTDVKELDLLPVSYNLSQNYPNPFNPSTVINYSLPQTSFVTVKIYDMLGREVKTLVNREENAGTHIVQWNGRNNNGQKVTSGTYIYRIQAGDFVEAKKMLLLK